MKEPVKALYTASEVARKLGRPKQTVSRWIQQGVLPTVRFCGQRFVPIEALQVSSTVWKSILLAAKVNDKVLA